MEQVHDDPRLQKNKNALERKRAADRIARRLERARTKEHIEKLEERVQLLLERDENSDFVQKILAENARLNERVQAYQKIVSSAAAVLKDPPKDSASSSVPGTTLDCGTSTGASILPPSDALTSGAQGFYEAPQDGHQSHNVGTEAANDDLTSLFSEQNFSRISHFLWNVGPKTLHTMQDTSPLDKTLIYRLSTGIPSFHQAYHNLESDSSLTQTLEDVMADEKLDTFFGNLLPFLDSPLRSLYAGIRDHLSLLSPGAILADLIPGFSLADHHSHMASDKSTNIIDLLKMSIAKDTSAAVLEAQGILRPDQRRSPAEMVAVFWIAYKLLTWMAFPTVNNYSQIPPWYRPTQAQLSISHPSYIDALVFPLLREKLVYTHNTYNTMKLLEDVNSLFTIAWEPKMWVISQDTPLIFMSPENAWEFELEANFKAAIWDLGSWRMMPEFTALYPELANCVHT